MVAILAGLLTLSILFIKSKQREICDPQEVQLFGIRFVLSSVRLITVMLRTKFTETNNFDYIIQFLIRIPFA